jgi:hypothetical protein
MIIIINLAEDVNKKLNKLIKKGLKKATAAKKTYLRIILYL